MIWLDLYFFRRDLYIGQAIRLKGKDQVCRIVSLPNKKDSRVGLYDVTDGYTQVKKSNIYPL